MSFDATTLSNYQDFAVAAAKPDTPHSAQTEHVHFDKEPIAIAGPLPNSPSYDPYSANYRRLGVMTRRENGVRKRFWLVTATAGIKAQNKGLIIAVPRDEIAPNYLRRKR